MKTLTIFSRVVTERTPWVHYRYKSARQIAIYYGGELITKNSDETPENPRLKIKFSKTLETRSKARLSQYIDSVSADRTKEGKWLYKALLDFESDLNGGCLK